MNNNDSTQNNNTVVDVEAAQPHGEQVPQKIATSSVKSTLDNGHVASSFLASPTLIHYVRLAVFSGVLVGFDQLLSFALKSIGTDFPSSVVGMVLLALVLLVLQTPAPSATQTLIKVCKPGIDFLSNWMALFFFILLVQLPLFEIPSAEDVGKLFFILIAGFFFTTFVGGMIPMVLHNTVKSWRYDAPSDTESSVSDEEDPLPSPEESADASKGAPTTTETAPVTAVAVTTTPTTTPEKPVELGPSWNAVALASYGAAAVLWLVTVIVSQAGNADVPVALLTPFHIFLTIGNFILVSKTLSKIGKWVPPALSFAVLTSSMVVIHGMTVGSDDNAASLGMYRTGTLSDGAAGDLIGLLLGPAVIQLAFKLLACREMLAKCVWKILISVSINLLVSFTTTAALAGALDLREDYALAIVPRFVTAPIGVGIANMTGADPSLTATFAVLSGTLGVIVGIPFLNVTRINRPVARGVALGSSSHGLGTAALNGDGEAEAAAVAGITFALMGAFAAVSLSIGAFREALVSML